MPGGSQKWLFVMQTVADVVIEVDKAFVGAWRSSDKQLLLTRKAIWMQPLCYGELKLTGDDETRKVGTPGITAPTLIVYKLSSSPDIADTLLSVSLDLAMNKADLWLFPGRIRTQDEEHEGYPLRTAVLPNVQQMLDKVVQSAQ